MYADVIVEYGVKSLDRTFTYLIPEKFKNKLKIGMKVVVPFGKVTINGFVINIKDTTENTDLKEIISITNEEFSLNKELLELGKYLKESTLCTLITAYNTMFPSSMKIKTIKNNYNLYDTYLRIKDINKAENYLNYNTKAFRRKEVITRLLDREIILKNEYNLEIINPLIKEGIIDIYKKTKYRINKGLILENKPKLTLDQEKAINEVNLNSNDIYLIHGVTGSGKTEVYMSLIEKVLKLNKTAIMLVPEISLTTQIVNRFYGRFGSEVAIFHSALSDGERHDEYKKILAGEVKVVVGTRSAIFVPLENIGVIIIDEEHSTNINKKIIPDIMLLI